MSSNTPTVHWYSNDAMVVDAMAIDATVDAMVDAMVDAAVHATVDATVDAVADAMVDAMVDDAMADDTMADAAVDVMVDAMFDAMIDDMVDNAMVDDDMVDAMVDVMVEEPAASDRNIFLPKRGTVPAYDAVYHAPLGPFSKLSIDRQPKGRQQCQNRTIRLRKALDDIRHTMPTVLELCTIPAVEISSIENRARGLGYTTSYTVPLS